MQDKHCILVVDKDETNINKFKTTFGGLYEIDTTGTTAEAVKLIQSNLNKYSIIIVALDMPVLDGFKFCLTLKQDIQVRDIPIIVTGTSLEFSTFDVPQGLRAGEFDKILFPFDNKTVLDMVEINIEKKKMLERLKTETVIDEETQLFTFTYFKEALDIEILRANKLKYTLSCLSMTFIEPDVKENLLSMIRNTCRHYDVACSHCEKILLLVPYTSEKEGKYVLNRFNTLIYGLRISLNNYNPETDDVEDFKQSILTQAQPQVQQEEHTGF